jgi:hypothetical protein
MAVHFGQDVPSLFLKIPASAIKKNAWKPIICSVLKKVVANELDYIPCIFQRILGACKIVSVYCGVCL